jgi:hypothetical protein
LVIYQNMGLGGLGRFGLVVLSLFGAYPPVWIDFGPDQESVPCSACA